MFTAASHQPNSPRVENGTLATVSEVAPQEGLWVQTREPQPREVALDAREAQQLRLAYAQHVYKAQGLTTERAHVLLGGWQTDRERAYVALTRARERTDVYVSRDDLGEDGLDEGAIERLAERMAHSHAQRASVIRAAKPVRDRATERATPVTHAAEAEPPRRGTGRGGVDVDDRTAGDGPRSEAGRLLAAQRERERAEIAADRERLADRPGAARAARGPDAAPNRSDLESADRDEDGRRVGRGAQKAGPAEEHDAPRSEAGRILAEQREREALDRGWGID